MVLYPQRRGVVSIPALGITYPGNIKPVSGTVTVPAIAAGTSILAPSKLNQTVLVVAIAAGTAVLAPTQVNQTVTVPAIAAGTTIEAPVVTRPVAVPALSAGTTILAPDRVDQTVIVPAISAATTILAPVITKPVPISVIAAATTILAPSRVDQTVAVAPISAATTILQPTTGGDVVVPAIAASTAVLAPAKVNQTVNVAVIAAGTTILAPVVLRPVTVPAIAAATTILTPVKVNQAIQVGTMAAGTTILPPLGAQNVTVPALSAGTSILAPRVDQAVTVAAMAAGTTILAPTLTSGIAVPAMAAGTSVLAPARIDQTVLVGTMAAGATILAPTVVPDQFVTVGVMAAATSFPVLTIPGSLEPALMAAATTILAPTVFLGAATFEGDIRSRFKAEVEDVISDRVQYPNTALKPPPTATEKWIDLEIDYTSNSAHKVGGRNTYRQLADIKARIHTPAGSFTKDARECADVIIAAFEHQTNGAAHYLSPYLGPDQNRREGAWNVLELVIPLYADLTEVRPASTDATLSLTKQNVGNILRSHFNTNVTLALSLPTAWDNVDFDPPGDADWTRFTIVEGQAQTIESGDQKRVRVVGMASTQIFVPQGQGDGGAVDLKDRISKLFRGTSIGGIRFGVPQIRKTGRHGSDAWYRINVNSPFSYDTTTA